MTVKEMKACAAETLSYFMQTMPDVPFTEDDIKFKFVHQKDMAECVKALCSECCPNKIINESQERQLAEDIAANAIIGREKSAVAVCINHKSDAQNWRRIFFHELTHIYCGKTEMDDEHFIDVYGSGRTPDENPEDKVYDGYVNAGYFIWSEFIAEYYALTKAENEKHTFAVVMDYIFSLLDEVNTSNQTNSKAPFAMACVYLLTCGDAEEILLKLNDSNFIIPDDVPYGKEVRLALKDCLEHLSAHLQTEKPWKINEKFISELGRKYIMFIAANSFFLGMM